MNSKVTNCTTMITPGPNPTAKGLLLTPPHTNTNAATTLITPPPNQAGNGQPTANPATGQNIPPQHTNNISAAAQNTINNINNNGLAATTITTILILPLLAPYLGPFIMTCCCFPITDNVAEAHCTWNTNVTLLMTMPPSSMLNHILCPCLWWIRKPTPWPYSTASQNSTNPWGYTKELTQWWDPSLHSWEKNHTWEHSHIRACDSVRMPYFVM